jgi:hypothetical protein
LPKEDPDCRLLAKDFRKLARLVSPPVPPRSATRVLKLVCKELSAESVVLVESVVAVVADEPVDSLVRDEIRLCMSATNPLLEPAPEIAPDAAALLPELLLSDCALSAAIKLCMKFRNAAATSLDEEELDDADAVPVVVEAAVDAVVAAAAELAVVAEAAPIDDSASKMAAIRPPAGDGGGADPEAAVLDVLGVV